MEAGQREAERQGTWKPSLSSKVLKPGTPEGEVGGAAAFLFHFQVQRSAVPAAWERAARNPAQSPFLHPQGPETRVLGIVQVTALPTLPRRVFSLFGVDMHAVCKFSRRVPLPSSVALPPPTPHPCFPSGGSVAHRQTDRCACAPVTCQAWLSDFCLPGTNGFLNCLRSTVMASSWQSDYYAKAHRTGLP